MLDEPTQGVDVGSRRQLYALLHSYAEESGRAVLFTSSDPDEIVALADRVLVLVDGQVASEHSGAEIEEKTLLSLAHGGDH